MDDAGAVDNNDLGFHGEDFIDDRRQSRVLALSEPSLDHYIAAFDPAERAQPIAERTPVGLSNRRADETDDGNAGGAVGTARARRDLLRPRRERPRRSRTADHPDELPPHPRVSVVNARRLARSPRRRGQAGSAAARG